nr:hypothetical protein Iba_chr09dCG10900 [Ipomoea batatas]
MPTVVEGSVSRTLGSKDSATNSFSTRRERGLGTGNRVWKRKQLQHISSDPLMNLRSLVEAHEDHASPPEEESFLQDNGKSPEVPDVTHPKEKSSGLDKGACSSDDDNDSSFDDSLKYKIWCRGLEMALEDGVFGTLSNNPSASSSGNANPKLKKNKKNKPPGNKMFRMLLLLVPLILAGGKLFPKVLTVFGRGVDAH